MELWAPMDRYRHLRQAAQLRKTAPAFWLLILHPSEPIRRSAPYIASFSSLLRSRFWERHSSSWEKTMPLSPRVTTRTIRF